LQADLPTGVDVKLQSLEGLANPDSLLLANLTVSGKLGVATAKRLIIPAQFFASTAKPLFAAGTRTFPIAFPGTAMKSDEVTLHLPPGLSVETLPQSLSIKLGGDNATYTVRLQAPSPGKPYLVTQRVSVLNRINYSPTGYGPLHTYYSKIAECDSDQIVLQTVPLAASK
jgi:hypothetical protein